MKIFYKERYILIERYFIIKIIILIILKKCMEKDIDVTNVIYVKKIIVFIEFFDNGWSFDFISCTIGLCLC